MGLKWAWNPRSCQKKNWKVEPNVMGQDRSYSRATFGYISRRKWLQRTVFLQTWKHPCIRSRCIDHLINIPPALVLCYELRTQQKLEWSSSKLRRHFRPSAKNDLISQKDLTIPCSEWLWMDIELSPTPLRCRHDSTMHARRMTKIIFCGLFPVTNSNFFVYYPVPAEFPLFLLGHACLNQQHANVACGYIFSRQDNSSHTHHIVKEIFLALPPKLSATFQVLVSGDNSTRLEMSCSLHAYLAQASRVCND